MNLKSLKFSRDTVSLDFYPRLNPAINFSSKFNLSNTLNLAFYAKFSYENSDTIQTAFKDFFKNNSYPEMFDSIFYEVIFQVPNPEQGALFNNFQFFNNSRTATQAFGYETPNDVIIAFRGTEPSVSELFKDFYIDSTCRQVDWAPGYGQVHQGFLAAFSSVAEEIEGHFYKAIALKKNFILTGHSLGAAIATLFAAYIRQKHKLPVMLYVYGSPRVGDSAFSKKFNESGIVAFRIQNSRDLISKIPPPHANARMTVFELAASPHGLILYAMTAADFDNHPYQHIGNCFSIHEHNGGGVSLYETEKEQIVLPKQDANRHFILGKELMDLFKGTGPLEGVANHSMQRYVSNLNQYLCSQINAYFEHNSDSLDRAKKALADTQDHLANLKRPQPLFSPSPVDALQTNSAASSQPKTSSPEIWEMQTRQTLRNRIMALQLQIRYFENNKNKTSLRELIGLQSEVEDQEDEFKRFVRLSTNTPS